MRLIMTVLCLICSLTLWAKSPVAPEVSLDDTLTPSAIIRLKKADVPIKGEAPGSRHVLLRVTTSRGQSSQISLPVRDGRFECLYPRQFKKAPKLGADVLFIDATSAASFDASDKQAEATLIVMRAGSTPPDLPTAFTNDLLDRKGQADQRSTEWSNMRALMNLYMRSRAAKICGVGRSDFDLAKPADLSWFKTNLALYEFQYRDRDWSTPLNHRVARNFWQSVWDTWFNSSNDHPLDGNPKNTSSDNYMPYAFSNDFADMLIMYLMRPTKHNLLDDNLPQMQQEGVLNLLAMQHTSADNFALLDHRGLQEHYTAGAFRYGVFADGSYMTEGKGWFYNLAFLDYAVGGCLNGRGMWGMGEALRRFPKGAIAEKLKAVIPLTVKFCLKDGLLGGYTKRTATGHLYWRDAGEHAYLVVGMLAASKVAPNLPVETANGKMSLQAACVDALNAFVDLEKPHHQWEVYPNTDSMAIAALADGCLLMPQNPDAKAWRKAATQVADAWMKTKVSPANFKGEVIHFGLRRTPETMTYIWGEVDSSSWQAHNFIFFYQTGHWTHALARLYQLTGDDRYRIRAEQMVTYLCGMNPWGVRLFNELGGVYNWVEDRDKDGIEDNLKFDMYPESTAFSQIGIMHLMKAIAH
ncbi:MAG: hypothetical protein ACYC1M_03655 [Armatimonadota bacterium]